MRILHNQPKRQPPPACAIALSAQSRNSRFTFHVSHVTPDTSGSTQQPRLVPRPSPLVPRFAFTLVEILIAIGILGLVLTAIYSTWTAILRASKIGRDSAAAVQRARMAGRILEEALSSAQYFERQSPAQAEDPFYDFWGKNGNEATLTFVSQLSSKYFPRSIRFGPWTVRRVVFSLRSSPDGGRELVLAQKPLLWDEMDEDEKNYPLVLARNVKEFKSEVWDNRTQDWIDIDEYTQTNSPPPMVKVTLKLADGPNSSTVREAVTRIVSLPSMGVRREWQPWKGGQGGPPVAPGQPPPGGQQPPLGGQQPPPSGFNSGGKFGPAR